MQTTSRILGIRSLAAAACLAMASMCGTALASTPHASHAAAKATWGPGAAPVPPERDVRLLSHDEATKMHLPREVKAPPHAQTSAERYMVRVYDAVDGDESNVFPGAVQAWWTNIN